MEILLYLIFIIITYIEKGQAKLEETMRNLGLQIATLSGKIDGSGGAGAPLGVGGAAGAAAAAAAGLDGGAAGGPFGGAGVGGGGPFGKLF